MSKRHKLRQSHTRKYKVKERAVLKEKIQLFRNIEKLGPEDDYCFCVRRVKGINSRRIPNPLKQKYKDMKKRNEPPKMEPHRYVLFMILDFCR